MASTMSSHSKQPSIQTTPLNIQDNPDITADMLDLSEINSDLSFQTDSHSIQPLPPTPQGSTIQHSTSSQPLDNCISKIPTPKESNSARNSQLLELVSPTSAAANTSNASKKSRRTIGPYQLTRTLGSGSMGKVKLAINTQTGEKFAVKIIPRKPPINDAQPKDEFREVRIHREIALLMLLNHPYIVSMKEAMIMPSHYYLFFEYVSGGQILDYIISHGKIKEKQARKFARQMLSAIEYCHRNSIVHRDLKIENILITDEGNIKIIDFGLSNLFSSTSQLSTFCGSLYFAAPELLNAKQYRGPEVDIWSLGIVFYVLVCGRVPFDDQSMPALHAKIKKGHVVYPNWLSKDCKHMLSRMLVTNSSERATMTELLRHPWINKGYDEPVDIYYPVREPLTLPLDPEIIRRMKGFDFGTEEHIQNEMENAILNSKKETHFLDHNSSLLTDLKKKAFFGRSRSPPPTSHPMVSVYYLVMEKMQRETDLSNKIYPRSPIPNQEELTPTDHHVEKPARPTPPKRPQSFSPGATASGQSLNTRDSNRTIKFDEEANMRPEDTPALSSKSSKMLRRLSSAVRVRPPVFHRFSHGPESDTEGKSNPDKFSRRFSKLINRRFTMQDNKHKRNSMSELDMLVGTNNSHNVSEAPSHPNGQPEDLISPRTINIPHLNLPSSPNDPNDVGYNQMNSHDNETDPKNEMADVAVKSMSLRGLFSVSTTSTKKLIVIKADLHRVLNELNIIYREKEGYLQCYYCNPDNPNNSPNYLDSYDDSAIMDKEGLKSPRKSSANSSSPQPMSPLNPSHSHHRSINGIPNPSASSDTPIEVSNDHADISYNTAPGNETNEYNGVSHSSSHVLFQIHIVKIKVLLRLYGIQFRRLEGPSWEYKAICSSILQNLKL